MEHNRNIFTEAATDEPVLPAATRKRPRPLARISDALTDSLIGQALDVGADIRPGRRQREDGWTPERIGVFLHALAQCGVVSDAARAAGMSARSAYALRSRARGRAFSLAWRAARLLARERVADELVSRALHGCVDVIVRDGQVELERHHYDNRLTMAVLTRLSEDAKSFDDEGRAARLVAGEFEQFVGIACAADSDAAADFIETRMSAAPKRAFGRFDEAELFERAGNYGRYGVGHPLEIEVSDLDPEKIDEWTEEQKERAERSGLMQRLRDEARERHFRDLR